MTNCEKCKKLATRIGRVYHHPVEDPEDIEEHFFCEEHFKQWKNDKR